MMVQRTVNIALGSATSTIGMTIPVALFIAFATKKPIELGLEMLQICVRQ
jgi:Ca2+/H+ antiporter